ncbi:MAG: class I SAM-dependent methyltransferase [Nanoarchaeota archaeon]
MGQHARLAQAFYNQIIHLHNQEFGYKGIQYKAWLDLLASKLGKGALVLDIGCGNGRALRYLIGKGLRGVGIDISESMLELARKNVPQGKFLKQDFVHLRYQRRSFAAIISFFALNHVSKAEFRDIISMSKTLLKKDGLLLLGMVKGKDEGLFTGFYGKKMALYGAGYSKKELTGILRSCGFINLKIGCEHFKGRHFEEDDIYILARARA